LDVHSPRLIKRGAALLALLLLALLPGAASAGMLTLTFPAGSSNAFSGSPPPAGPLTAVFADGTGTGPGGNGIPTGDVRLVITSKLGAGENLDPGKALYLNIDPAKDGQLANLSFSLVSNTNFSQAATVLTGADSFKADGTGGYFDLLFTYDSSTKAFTNGESQTYLISNPGKTVSAADFEFANEDVGYYGAVHIQNSGSVWVSANTSYDSGAGNDDSGGGGDPLATAVPAPPSLVLLGLGSFGFVAMLARLRKQQSVVAA
jgi:hypothetical protein